MEKKKEFEELTVCESTSFVKDIAEMQKRIDDLEHGIDLILFHTLMPFDAIINMPEPNDKNIKWIITKINVMRDRIMKDLKP